MENQTQSTDWTKYFLIKHPPFVIAGPWVSLVPALKQQLSFPLPHSSPQCFQWRKKQQLPEGYVHMKLQKRKVWFICTALILLARIMWNLISTDVDFFFSFVVPTNAIERQVLINIFATRANEPTYFRNTRLNIQGVIEVWDFCLQSSGETGSYWTPFWH